MDKDVAQIIADVSSEIAEAIGVTFYQLSDALFEIYYGQMAEYQKLRAVATNRQWHLYTHGPVKVSKKWYNALCRKAKVAEKRRKK